MKKDTKNQKKRNKGNRTNHKKEDTGRSSFWWYKLLCCLMLLLLYAGGCSFVWNAVSVYVFAYDGQGDGVRQELLWEEDEPEGCGYEETEFVCVEQRLSADDILSENSLKREEKKEPEKEFSRDDWRLVLINKQHAIPEDYTFTFGSIHTAKGTMKCDERIIPDLLEMLKAAKEDGINLQICSPYRDMNRQTYLFNKKIKNYMKQEMSYLDAYALTSQAVTVPGASEHQIGLALDIVSDTYSYLNEGFGDTTAGKWLAEHSCEYGFILRYPKGKEYVTGIEYEPWHFRYVGADAAEIIMKEDLTLEEFVDSLEDWTK